MSMPNVDVNPNVLVRLSGWEEAQHPSFTTQSVYSLYAPLHHLQNALENKSSHSPHLSFLTQQIHADEQISRSLCNAFVCFVECNQRIGVNLGAPSPFTTKMEFRRWLCVLLHFTNVFPSVHFHCSSATVCLTPWANWYGGRALRDHAFGILHAH